MTSPLLPSLPAPLGTVFLIAGEPSGDTLGARLMSALRQQHGAGVRFVGVGGPRMTEQGLESLFPMEELAVMGLFEILPKLPQLIRRVGDTAATIQRTQPDVLITIDAPDFSFPVVRRLKRPSFPVIHFVAPTVWAWRPGRAKVVAGLYDHLLCLLPFEPPYFEAVGLDATFIGHPVVEGPLGSADAGRFRQQFGLADADRPLVVLPGSRRVEVTRLLPIFREAVARLVERHPDLRPVVPTVPHVAGMVREAVSGWPGDPIVLVDEQAKYDAFKAAHAAIAASGTVALELSLSGTPTVVAYKVSWLTAMIMKRVILVDTVTLTNLITQDKVIAEYIQEACTPEALVAEAERLLTDDELRRRQVLAGQAVGQVLGLTGDTKPSQNSAAAVTRVVETWNLQRRAVTGPIG